MLVVLVLLAGCRDGTLRLTHSLPDVGLTEKVISRYGPADVTLAWVNGQNELSVALKDTTFSAMGPAAKRDTASVVADYVRSLVAGDSSIVRIRVGFVETRRHGVVETSRSTMFDFPGTRPAPSG